MDLFDLGEGFAGGKGVLKCGDCRRCKAQGVDGDGGIGKSGHIS